MPGPVAAEAVAEAVADRLGHGSALGGVQVIGSGAVVGSTVRPSAGYESVMWGVMSAAGREEFLAGVRVGVLSAAVRTTGRTLAVPVRYTLPTRRPGDSADRDPSRSA